MEGAMSTRRLKMGDDELRQLVAQVTAKLDAIMDKLTDIMANAGDPALRSALVKLDDELRSRSGGCADPIRVNDQGPPDL
jgi:hypothetical protein